MYAPKGYKDSILQYNGTNFQKGLLLLRRGVNLAPYES